MTDTSAAQGKGMHSGKSFLERLQLLVGVMLAVVAGYSAWQLNAAEKSLKENEINRLARESDRKDSEAARTNRESIEKKQLMVYEAVVKSLEGGDPRKQRISKALVTAMLEDPLRTELLTVLTESGAPEIKREALTTLAQESTFKAEERVTRKAPGQPSSEWANWDFDIFWCERSGDPAKAQAEAITKQLAQEGAKGRLRVRLLPDSINARPGYQNTGYVIRYNASEDLLASRLKTLGDKIVGPAAAFLPALSSQPTPWYLSAFICPASR